MRRAASAMLLCLMLILSGCMHEKDVEPLEDDEPVTYTLVVEDHPDELDNSNASNLLNVAYKSSDGSELNWAMIKIEIFSNEQYPEWCREEGHSSSDDECAVFQDDDDPQRWEVLEILRVKKVNSDSICTEPCTLTLIVKHSGEGIIMQGSYDIE